MDDGIEASRLEQLLLYNEKSQPKLNHTFNRVKLTRKGENRLNLLLNKRFS